MLPDKKMMEKCVLVSHDEGATANNALNNMTPTIENVLQKASDDKACNPWVLHQVISSFENHLCCTEVKN